MNCPNSLKFGEDFDLLQKECDDCWFRHFHIWQECAIETAKHLGVKEVLSDRM